MIDKIRNWMKARKERLEKERLQRQQERDEAFFDLAFLYAKVEAAKRSESREEYEQMIEGLDKMKSEALDARRKKREAGEDVKIGI